MNTCIHCHRPADKRCGNVLDLGNGDRLHRACLTPHLLMVAGAIPDPPPHKRLARPGDDTRRPAAAAPDVAAAV